MNYWLDLFTGTTWSEFREAGSNVSGFRSTRQKMVERIKPGDILLCYLTGVMRWVCALEVVGPSKDERAIWKFDEFPARLDVKPLVMLNPENGIPMEKLAGKVQFYQESKDAGKFKGFLRGSPATFARHEDGDLILQILKEAKEHPIAIPVDQRKLKRIPLYKTKGRVGDKKVDTVVSVPDTEEVEDISTCNIAANEANTPGTAHTEIQYLLLTLGAEMGLDIWVARNDRSKIWNDQMLGSLPHMTEELPTQFNEATQRQLS